LSPTSAPLSSRSEATAVFPDLAASWRGVNPPCSRADTGAEGERGGQRETGAGSQEGRGRVQLHSAGAENPPPPLQEAL